MGGYKSLGVCFLVVGALNQPLSARQATQRFLMLHILIPFGHSKLSEAMKKNMEGDGQAFFKAKIKFNQP